MARLVSGCRVLSHPRPSLPTPPPFCCTPVTFLRWKLLFKKKEKEKEKGATAVSGLQIQQAKYRARFLWEGLLPHWPVHSRSLIYIFTNLVPCTIRNKTPHPSTTTWSRVPNPRQEGDGSEKKGRKRQTQERVCGRTGAMASK
jgi:hypothetical protein